MLAHYTHLEAIPDDPREWAVTVRGAEALAASLVANRVGAALWKRLATLRFDVPLAENVDALRWRGATPDLAGFCASIGFESFLERVPQPRS